MADQDDPEWTLQQQHGHNVPYPSDYYGPTAQSTMRGMQDVDLSMFQDDTALYQAPYGANPSQHPSIAYSNDVQWASDVDMATPSTTFSHDLMDVYRMEQQAQAHSHDRLRPPPTPHQQTNHSPTPRNQVFSAPITPQLDRPTFPRSTTAPEPRSNTRPHHSTAASSNTKRSGSDSGDSCPEGTEPTINTSGAKSTRGRKRQRIPHTAVERRYRENLNAHLDKLRQTVPALASRRLSSAQAQGKCVEAEGAKPSKCEILNGAIEYIGGLDRENRGLRDEVKMLRGRLEDLERWYSASLRGGG